MKKYFLDLFEYNNWANDKLILQFQKLNFEFQKEDPIKLLSHIVSTQDTWLERVKGKNSYNIFLWEEYSIQELEILSLNSHKGWIKFITGMSENKFHEHCNYKNSKRENNSRPYQDIFQHVIIHSAHHRGQINQILAMNNLETVKIDFIYYC